MASAPIIPKVGSMEAGKVQNSVDNYMSLHDDTKGDKSKERKEKYTDLVNGYYDLATDFYEWGWGQSFHFAVRRNKENFYAALARHEHFLPLRMNTLPSHRLLDVGCGVGGPAREIARFSGAHVTGLNNNAYQVERANIHTAREDLVSRCSFVKADFMHLPFEDNSFDGVYQIEATAHAPSKEGVFAEIFRVLKPGACFASYEWCLTDAFDADNAEHQAIKKGIEEGNGLPDIATTHQVIAALKAVGFVVEQEEDRALQITKVDLPWYTDLEPRYTPLNFQHTELGHGMLKKTLNSLERIGVVAAGTCQVQDFLHTAAVYLVKGGQTRTFTPSFFTLARKPL